MRQYMLDMAEARIRQNCSTWKYRVTQGLIRHVRELMAADPKFKAATNKRKIVKYLKGKFSLDTFARIFDFVKDWINLGGSSVRVHQWCKTLYVELGSHAKMHVNWLDQPDESRLAKSNFSRAGLTDRISSAAGSTSWAHLVPELEEIVLCEKKAYDRSKKKANEFLKPDDDQDFYVPGESDSDE
ncbi:hypothetical protein ANO14919_021910 [Xylariales sp. No.14919]|nr:hypothetical protein ANO14919_021910 [Xylariales sp. No.14919]